MGYCFLHGQPGGGGGGSGEGEIEFPLFLDGSRPEDAAEGSISVDPASFAAGASGEYIFSETEPAGEEGLLWVKTGTEGLGVTMDKPLSISMNLRGALMFHNGWKDVIAQVRTGGRWMEFAFGAATVPEIVPWATGTDSQIARMVTAMDMGILSVEDSGWQVGDTRRVKLKAMGDVTSSVSHAEQLVELVLGNVGGKTLEDGKECHFVVLQKDCLVNKGPMNLAVSNYGGWKDCLRRAWCNDVYAAALPDTLRPIFKPFRNITGSSGGLQETIDTFALASTGEFLNSGSYSYPDEFREQKQFAWYQQDANNLLKNTGTSIGMWFSRSPCASGSSKSSAFTGCTNGGTISYWNANNYGGIAPFGCI